MRTDKPGKSEPGKPRATWAGAVWAGAMRPLRLTPLARPLAALAALAVHALAAATLLLVARAPSAPHARGERLTLLSLPMPRNEAETLPRRPVSSRRPARPQRPKPEVAEPPAYARPTPSLRPIAQAVTNISMPSNPRPAALPITPTPASTAPSTAAEAEPPSPPARAAPGAPANVEQAYARRLWAHIASRRPAGIRLEGTSQVAFRLDRSGKVTTLRLVRSSGNAMLDALALRIVKRAAPMPEPPAELNDAQLAFTLPIGFR